MDWIDYENEKPKFAGYFLCKIWGFSGNEYGNSTRFQVVYFNGKEFSGYPLKEFHQNKVFAFEKVLYWCDIDETPYNKEHYKITITIEEV